MLGEATTTLKSPLLIVSKLVPHSENNQTPTGLKPWKNLNPLLYKIWTLFLFETLGMRLWVWPLEQTPVWWLKPIPSLNALTQPIWCCGLDSGSAVGEEPFACHAEPLCWLASGRSRLSAWRLVALHLPADGDTWHQRHHPGRRERRSRGREHHAAPWARHSGEDGGGAREERRRRHGPTPSFASVPPLPSPPP